MKITDSCAQCLYNKQKKFSTDENYLSEIRRVIDERKDGDTPPLLIYEFSRIHERYYGKPVSYREEKKRFNDLVLSLQDDIREKIETSADPLRVSLSYARVGNYIDYGALDEVKENDFLQILDGATLSETDERTVDHLLTKLSTAKSFLLICDNCGEIVLDRLFLEQLHKRYPELKLRVMVRGGEALNDATAEDALYVGMDAYAQIVSSGVATAGTIYSLMSDEARKVLDETEVILAKGQGNYESLSEQGRHIFYAFLCKCDKFTANFGVKQFEGIFIEE